MDISLSAMREKRLHSGTFKTSLSIANKGKKFSKSPDASYLVLKPSRPPSGSIKSKSYRASSFAINPLEKNKKIIQEPDEKLIERKAKLEEELGDILGMQYSKPISVYQPPDWRENNRAFKDFRHIRHAGNYGNSTAFAKKK